MTGPPGERTPTKPRSFGRANVPPEVPHSPRQRSLVVVSNRLPFIAERGPDGLRLRRSSGGLVTALDPVLAERGGVWIGWPGADAPVGPALLPDGGGVRYRAVTLAPHDASAYYGGFANRTLWPLFHYFVSRARIDGNTWRAYERVNEQFAVAAAEESRAGDLVWVHDYHLLRVPHYLRHTAAGRRIAFFLHIPFPAYDVFRVLPWCRTLLRGILSADLVGLHVGEYVGHVLTCAERLLGCDVDRASGIVQFDGRPVTVRAHPIGIDVQRTEAAATAAARVERVAEPRAQVIGLDRLDYTKGIFERFLAFERFLERYPAFHGRVEFTQVVIPSRELVQEYRALKRELDEAVGRINGRFSDAGWTPLRYLVRSLSPDELGAFYRDADIALVTPLRDGMNLVAKEYVASQVESAGVLILSELAGAAEELQEALLVNPYDPDAVADMLHRALTLPADERRARMSALRDRVRGNSVHAWVDGVLDAAEVASARASAGDRSVVERLERRLGPWLAQRPDVALFFDYDGTLTPLAEEPEQATLPEATRQALEAAARAPHVQLVIVSGRAIDDVSGLVGVPGITYVGNHGFEMDGPGLSFRHPRVSDYVERIREAAGKLEALGIAGARVESKGATLSYHTRRVAPEIRDAVERKAHVLLRRLGLAVGRGKAVIEGRPPIAWHKGSAVLHVLRERHGADWPGRVRALYVGDDVTDEDAFRSLRGIGRSVLVGRAGGTTTQADYSLPDPAAVGQLLRWLAAGGFQGERPVPPAGSHSAA